MNSVRRKTLGAISAIVIVCLFQVCVVAGAANANSTTVANGLVLGRLTLAESESILVNGNSANSGTTILSGSRLQTPDDVEATVQLGSAGTLYIEPNTNLTVTFDKTNVQVKVASGKGFVAANPGVLSSITGPDDTTSAAEPGAPPAPMSHKKKAALIAAGIIIPVVIISVVVATSGS